MNTEPHSYQNDDWLKIIYEETNKETGKKETRYIITRYESIIQVGNDYITTGTHTNQVTTPLEKIVSISWGTMARIFVH